MHSAKYLQTFVRDSTKNISTVVSSETSVYFHQTSRLHVLEDGLIHVHQCVNSELNVTLHSPVFRQQLLRDKINQL
jgi:hypothetical protein